MLACWGLVLLLCVCVFKRVKGWVVLHWGGGGGVQGRAER